LYRDLWIAQYRWTLRTYITNACILRFSLIFDHFARRVQSDRSFPDIITKCKRFRRAAIAKITMQILSLTSDIDECVSRKRKRLISFDFTTVTR